jgi:hypothetical protein
MELTFITHTSPAQALIAFAVAPCTPGPWAMLKVDGNVRALVGRYAA